jgi:hypothetical protein
MFLLVWKNAKMHQNTFLTTTDGKKYFFFPGCLEACEYASKHIFINSRRKNINFFLVVWKHAQIHQKTFLTTPDAKKYFFSGGLEACANASKHVFNHS